MASVLSALLAVVVAATSSSIAHIHGKIVAIDAKHGVFSIHHDAFPQMPMAMTMDVKPVHRADLAKLHVGEVVNATIDTAAMPWRGIEVHAAR